MPLITVRPLRARSITYPWTVGEDQTTTPQPSKNMIQHLPIENLQQIADLLPVSSAAAMSLASKSLLYVLGHQYLYTMRGEFANEPELRKFLLLIEKDLPGYYACLDCLRLHPHKASAPVAPRKFHMFRRASRQLKHRPCKDMDAEAEAALFNDKQIDFHILHDLMQQHKAGNLDPEALQRLSTTKLKSKGRESTALHRSVEFRIVSDQLLLQGVYRIRTDPKQKLPAEALKRMYVCPHLRHGKESSNVINGKLQSIVKNLNTLEPCTHCGSVHQKLECVSSDLQETRPSDDYSKLFSCDQCPTEFEASIEPKGPSAVDVVITRWINLGSLDSPYTPHYRSHMYHRFWRSFEDGIATSLVDWEPGTIKAAFLS